MLKPNEIDDDDPGCLETSATFRVFSKQIHPDEVTRILGLEPTRVTLKGGRRKSFGWTLTTDKVVTSRDVRRHVDWLLERLLPRQQALLELDAAGASTDIFCGWVSASGQGGPAVTPRQMQGLAALNLDIGWDIYADGEQLRVAQVSEDSESLLLIVDDSVGAFENAARRLTDGRRLQFMGRGVTIRLDPDDEGGYFDSNPQGTIYTWRMTPAEVTETADQLIAFSRRPDSTRVELRPGQNRAGIRIFISSGEYYVLSSYDGICSWSPRL